jgi:hypothetical protein
LLAAAALISTVGAESQMIGFSITPDVRLKAAFLPYFFVTFLDFTEKVWGKFDKFLRKPF